jgi:hypothetical protein
MHDILADTSIFAGFFVAAAQQPLSGIPLADTTLTHQAAAVPGASSGAGKPKPRKTKVAYPCVIPGCIETHRNGKEGCCHLPDCRAALKLPAGTVSLKIHEGPLGIGIVHAPNPVPYAICFDSLTGVGDAPMLASERLQPGMYLVCVNGTSTENISYELAKGLLRGRPCLLSFGSAANFSGAVTSMVPPMTTLPYVAVTSMGGGAVGSSARQYDSTDDELYLSNSYIGYEDELVFGQYLSEGAAACVYEGTYQVQQHVRSPHCTLIASSPPHCKLVPSF